MRSSQTTRSGVVLPVVVLPVLDPFAQFLISLTARSGVVLLISLHPGQQLGFF